MSACRAASARPLSRFSLIETLLLLDSDPPYRAPLNSVLSKESVSFRMRSHSGLGLQDSTSFRRATVHPVKSFSLKSCLHT